MLLGCLLAGCSSSRPAVEAPRAPGVEVQFAVDMRKPIRTGTFDPAVDSVGVMGDTAPLSWIDRLHMTDADRDSIYEATVRFATLPPEGWPI